MATAMIAQSVVSILFEYAGDYDICPVCGWEDELMQLADPDEEDCTNHMSLNQAREAWKNGQKVG